MRSGSIMAAERHLGVEDLAERYGVGVHTIYWWNRMKTGPRYFMAGRHCRYRLADVEAWENSRYTDGAA